MYRLGVPTEVAPLPARLAEPCAMPDEAEGSRGARPERDRPVLLLVDDEAGVRRTMGLMLELGGFRVITAASGAEALAQLALRTDQVSALVTDQNMPGMTGSELVSRMHERGIDLPVLFVSGRPQAALASASYTTAPQRFLAKPFTQATLLAELRMLLRSSQSASQS